MEYAARTAFHTFTACQAIRIFDGFSKPGMQPDVNADRAIERADSTLNTAFRFRDNMPGCQCFYTVGFIAEWKIHKDWNFH